jgi:hypothetical protein
VEVWQVLILQVILLLQEQVAVVVKELVAVEQVVF